MVLTLPLSRSINFTSQSSGISESIHLSLPALLDSTMYSILFANLDTVHTHIFLGTHCPFNHPNNSSSNGGQ